MSKMKTLLISKSNLSKLMQLLCYKKQQIGKLKEYKTTLFNSAGTGKIKVPETDSGIN